ncbi:type I restriction endonuclease [Borrelia turicatae]|uniref:type I restriction endonuclease n=1 Tax=Borrelia turicatae TaxID=142 RepID=UPI002ED05E3A
MSYKYKTINNTHFIEAIKCVSTKIQASKDYIENEAQTKQVLINPFLYAMGYDPTDHFVVQVEATADIPDHNGMKVDYILYPKEDREPTILIEVKYHKNREKLENYFKQLKLYFQNIRSQEKRVEFGILTNGIESIFYTDLDKDNLLDKEPFMVINLEKLTPKDFEYLEKFSKNSINIEEAKSFALEKKYTDKLVAYFKKEIENTSEDFSKFLKTKIGFNKKKSNKIFKNIIIKNTFRTFTENNSILINNIENKNKTKNLKKFEKLSFDMKTIYQDLESFIFTLKPNKIDKVETKLYTGFKVYNRCFADFIFMPKENKIHITVSVSLNQITLKEGFTRDIGNIGNHGNGNIQIFCTLDSKIQEIKNLIKISYDNKFQKYKKELS